MSTDGRCQCGAYTESSSGLCPQCIGRSRIYNSSGFVGFADEVRAAMSQQDARVMQQSPSELIEEIGGTLKPEDQR